MAEGPRVMLRAMRPVYVIAEAGSCHDGRISDMLGLVHAAHRARADAVKFQYWSDPDMLADRRRVPPHYREIYRRYGVTPTMLAAAATEAAHCGLDFLCTVYMPQDIDTVGPLVKHWKVASFEADGTDLLAALVLRMETQKESHPDRLLIVSCGMDAQPYRTIPYLMSPRVRTLLCVSAYPAPAASLGLHRMPFFDGFSDHTAPSLTWTGGLAVAAGARVIEAHLRLETTDAANPDAPHAMTPGQFAEYVEHVRFAAMCVGVPHESASRAMAEADMARYKVGTK